ncbi:E3 ubiquitin-protein ligase RFWD2, partial [Stegodyphus mimosarum]
MRLVEEMHQSHTLRSLNTIGHSSGVHLKSEPTTSKACTYNSCVSNLPKQDGFNGSKYVNKFHNVPSLASRRKRMHEHFSDLEQSYLNLRCKGLVFSSCGDVSRSGLDDFDESLSKFTRFSYVRPLATLNYANDHFNSSNIVSSIEFDKDNEYFAIAGVT